MADNIDDLLVEDASSQEIAPDTLAQITTSAHELQQVRKRIANGMQLLEELQNEELRLSTEVLPQLLDTAGVSKLTLDDGEEISREENVFASLAKDKATAACAWLEKHGYGGIVKGQFIIPLPKGNPKAIAKIRAALKKTRIKFEEVVSVHPQTLKAFVRESLEESRDLSRSQITYHVQPTVKLKAKK